MAPIIMGNPDRPELGQELTNSFCRTDPEIAKAFARVTLTSDNRQDLAEVTVPTLVLQCSEDIIASHEVGEFVNRNIRIGQLLSNLLGNALTHGAADKPVVVHAETRDGSFELWVANAGQPIPPSSIEQLFEPFFRGKARASRQGLGLGLYIASQIARTHGGTLSIGARGDPLHLLHAMPLG